MTQYAYRISEAAKFDPISRHPPCDSVPGVRKIELARLYKACPGRISLMASLFDFGSSFAGWVVRSPWSIVELRTDKGHLWRTSSITCVESSAEDVDSFLAGAENVSDAF